MSHYPDPATPVARLKNLGKTSAEWLHSVGVYTLGDLERAGPIPTYRLIKAQGRHVTLNLLCALQGALLNILWNELPRDMRDELRRAAQEK